MVGTVAGSASATLNEILKEIESLVAEPAKAESEQDDPNPFWALFGFESRQSERQDKDADDRAPTSWWSVKPDNEVEAVIRSLAILGARRRCLEFYNRCKVILGMPWF